MGWFENKYKCRYCFSIYGNLTRDVHGKGQCPDNRRLHGLRILQRITGYAVQGEYSFSSGGYLPIPHFYWDDIQEFKTLKAARKFKNELELKKGKVIE